MAVVGLVTGLAMLSGGMRARQASPITAQAAVEEAVRSCEERVRPELREPVARWQLTGEAAEPQGIMLTFAADVGGRSVTYRCDVTPSGATIAALGGP